jgi:hypothetical protein
MAIREISNEQLRESDIPGPGADWQAISEFALAFDGYQIWGSFEKCAEIANARRAESLTDLRTCLFFEQRRWRHFGEQPDEEAMAYIRGILEQVRGIVRSRARWLSRDSLVASWPPIVAGKMSR